MNIPEILVSNQHQSFALGMSVLAGPRKGLLRERQRRSLGRGEGFSGWRVFMFCLALCIVQRIDSRTSSADQAEDEVEGFRFVLTKVCIHDISHQTCSYKFEISTSPPSVEQVAKR